MLERFTDDARNVVAVARERSRELGHSWIGTEHLLLALLDPGSGATAGLLREAGVDAAAVRSSLARHVATSRPQGPPLTDEDAQALRTIGIDLQAVLARLEETLGSGALTVPAPPERPGRRRTLLLRRRPARDGSCRPGFTARAKKVLELGVREAMAGHRDRIASEHLLLGLLREGHGLAATLLQEQGVDVTALRAATLRSLDAAA
jgi:ATP-dependent Clp protease ATP-binding subunit ClpA